MISDKVKIALIKVAPTLSHIELIELVIEECQQAQRQWVGLTDEETNTEAVKEEQAYGFVQGALWAEAKLKEKNA